MRRRRHTRDITYDEWAEHDGMLNAPRLLDPVHEGKLSEGIRRAGGEAVCETCGLTFHDHPRVVGALWATELCDGSLVKL